MTVTGEGDKIIVGQLIPFSNGSTHSWAWYGYITTLVLGVILNILSISLFCYTQYTSNQYQSSTNNKQLKYKQNVPPPLMQKIKKETSEKEKNVNIIAPEPKKDEDHKEKEMSPKFINKPIAWGPNDNNNIDNNKVIINQEDKVHDNSVQINNNKINDNHRLLDINHNNVSMIHSNNKSSIITNNNLSSTQGSTANNNNNNNGSERQKKSFAFFMVLLNIDDLLWSILCLTQCTLNYSVKQINGGTNACVFMAFQVTFFIILISNKLGLLSFFSLSAFKYGRFHSLKSTFLYNIMLYICTGIITALSLWLPYAGPRLVSSGTWCFVDIYSVVGGTIFFLAGVGFPGLIMMYCYYHVYKSIHIQNKYVETTLKQMEDNNNSINVYGLAKRGQIKHLLQMLLFIAGFLACACPFVAMALYEWITGTYAYAYFDGVAGIFAHLISVINPLICILISDKYRNIILEIILNSYLFTLLAKNNKKLKEWKITKLNYINTLRNIENNRIQYNNLLAQQDEQLELQMNHPHNNNHNSQRTDSPMIHSSPLKHLTTTTNIPNSPHGTLVSTHSNQLATGRTMDMLKNPMIFNSILEYSRESMNSESLLFWQSIVRLKQLAKHFNEHVTQVIGRNNELAHTYLLGGSESELITSYQSIETSVNNIFSLFLNQPYAPLEINISFHILKQIKQRLSKYETATNNNKDSKDPQANKNHDLTHISFSFAKVEKIKINIEDNYKDDYQVMGNNHYDGEDENSLKEKNNKKINVYKQSLQEKANIVHEAVGSFDAAFKEISNLIYFDILPRYMASDSFVNLNLAQEEFKLDP